MKLRYTDRVTFLMARDVKGEVIALAARESNNNYLSYLLFLFLNPILSLSPFLPFLPFNIELTWRIY